MADQTLTEYIRRSISRGSKVDEIEKKLLAEGWSQVDIEDSLEALADQAQTSRKASGKMWMAIIAATLIVGVGGIVAASFLIFGGFTLPEWNSDSAGAGNTGGLAAAGNGTGCGAKPEGVYRAMCYTDLARETDDITACNSLRNTDERKYKDICVRDYAVGKMDVDLCGMVQNDYIKEQCIDRIKEKAGG
jgi:hypothetical protein